LPIIFENHPPSYPPPASGGGIRWGGKIFDREHNIFDRKVNYSPVVQTKSEWNNGVME
jgi:hypothetical protein